MIDLFDQIRKHPIVKRYMRQAMAGNKIFLRWCRQNLPIYLKRSSVQVGLFVFTIFFLFMICIFYQVGNRFDNTLYIINIPKGYGASQVSELLESRGIIEGRYGFNIIVNLFRLQNKMQAGTYEFTPNMSLVKIVWRIGKGDVIPPMMVRLVLPEGTSIYKMSRFMAREGIGDAIAFRDLTNTKLVDRLKEKYTFLNYDPTRSLEGYLFPDTYLVQSNIDIDMLTELMLSRFNKVIVAYWNKNHRKMKSKLSFHEVLTLASIIEKEAAIDKERATISSVYMNRLKIRMQLGADPTIKYALERPGKIVSYDDLKIKSPYNTYRNYGLPPGPICSPGLESFKAAMFPVKTDYLYFVARGDGSHIFSKTLVEHKSAQELTRKDRIKKIYRVN